MKTRIDNNVSDFGEFGPQGTAREEGSVGNAGTEFDLRSIIAKALKGWRTILIWAGCAAALGVVVALSVPKEFTSTAVVAPEITSRASSGGLTSLANLAGVNINTMAVTDAMHPDMYPVIINSSTFLMSLLDMPVSVEDKTEGVIDTNLYDYMLNRCKAPWWGVLMGLPMKAKDVVFGWFKKTPDDDVETEGMPADTLLRLSREQEGIVRALAKSIETKVEKKTYILTVRATMQDRMVAANLANKVVENLQQFVIDYRTEKGRMNVDYYQEQTDQAREEYLKAQRAYAYYVDAHQETIRKSYAVETQRLQNEANLRYQMYNSMAQNLMQAEAKVQLETPVLVTIQPALAPNIGHPSRVKTVMLWFFLGLLAGALWVVWGKDNLRKPQPPEETEKEELPE